MASNRALGTVDVATGALYGAGAYLVGLVLTYVFVEAEVIEELALYVSFIDGFAGYQFGFLVAHELNVLTSPDVAGEYLPLTLLLAVVLVGAGYLAAGAAGGSRGSSGVRAGASIFVGYVVLALLGTAVAVLTFDGDVDATDMIVKVVVTGLVYPAVFGAIGGALAANR